MALLAHQTLGCRGVSRSDFRYDDRKPGDDRPLFPRDQHAAGHDADLAGARAGAARRHLVRRAVRLAGGGRAMPRMRIAPPRRPARRSRQRQPAGMAAGAAHAARSPPRRRARRSYSACRSTLWRAGVPEAVADAYDDARHSVLAATGSAGLKVREILVEGRGETPARHVLAVLDVKRGVADPRLRSGAGADASWSACPGSGTHRSSAACPTRSSFASSSAGRWRCGSTARAFR